MNGRDRKKWAIRQAALDRQGIVDTVFRALGTEASRVLQA